jgi:hypothetical protein
MTEKSGEQQALSLPVEIGSQSSPHGNLSEWLHQSKKELESLLETPSVDHNLLLKKLAQVMNRLEESRIFGVEVETKPSPQLSTDESPVFVRKINLDVTSTIKIIAMRDQFAEKLEALHEAEGRLYRALDGTLNRSVSRLKDELKRITDGMASFDENDDFTTLEQKKYSVENAQKELAKIREEIQSVLNTPQPIVITIAGQSGYSSPIEQGSPPMRKYSSMEGAPSPRRLLERSSPSRQSLDLSKLDIETWTSCHRSVMIVAMEIMSEAEDLIALCGDRLKSFDDLYHEKIEEFHTDLARVEAWIKEICHVMRLEPLEEEEAKQVVEEDPTSLGSERTYDIDALISLLESYSASLDSQRHNIRKVLIFGKLVDSITRNDDSSNLKSRLEALDSNWKPVPSQMHLRISELKQQNHMNKVSRLLQEAAHELSQLSDIYLTSDEMVASLETLQEFFQGKEFQENTEKELVLLRTSVQVYLDAAASHHDNAEGESYAMPVDRDEVISTVENFESDLEDLCRQAASLESFLSEGIKVWEGLASSSDAFLQWLEESEDIADREFVGSTVDEAEAFFAVIVGIIDACDQMEVELDRILAVANGMFEHGITEEAGSVVDTQMEQLKVDWTRLCEKLENINIEVNEIVDYWKQYNEVYEEVSSFMAKLSSKLPKDPIESADGDPQTLKKYKSYKRKLKRMEPMFAKLQELGKKLIESGRIQSAELLESDLSQFCDRWEWMRDNISASHEALMLEHEDLTENSFRKLVTILSEGESLLQEVKDHLHSWPRPVRDVAMDTPLVGDLTKYLHKLKESFSTEAKFSFESIKSDCLSRLVPPVSSPTPMSPPGEGSGPSNVPALVVSPVSKSPLSRVTVTEDAIEDLLLKWIDLCGEANSLANFMDLLSKLLPLWHVAHDDLERCQALFIYCGPLVRVQEKLTEHTSHLSEDHVSELRENLALVEAAALEAECTPPEQKETRELLEGLGVLPGFLTEVKDAVEEVEPAGNKVVRHLALLIDLWSSYLEARGNLVLFLDKAEPQVEEIHRKCHPGRKQEEEVSQPEAESSKQEVETNMTTLPSRLVEKLQVVMVEKEGVKPHYLTVVTVGTKICNSFHSQQEVEKTELRMEVDTFMGRWKAVEVSVDSLNKDCQSLHDRFKGFLFDMGNLAFWVYSALEKITKAQNFEKQGGGGGQHSISGGVEEVDTPTNLWVVIQEIEEGISTNRPKVDSLTNEVLPWQQLPFLEEKDAEYPKQFVHEVSSWDDVDGEETVETVITDDGVHVLAGKFKDVEDKVLALRQELESKSDMVTLLTARLDELQHWISKRQLDMDRILCKPLTPHVPTAKSVLKSLKDILQDLTKRSDHKNGLLAEASGVLHQVSPAMATIMKEKMANIASCWNIVEEESGKNTTKLESFVPMMEDLWFKLGQFEEFLTKMESGLSDLKPVEADLPKLESQKPNLESQKEDFLGCPVHVSEMREPWDKLTATYPSLKSPPALSETSSLSPVGSPSFGDSSKSVNANVDFETRIGSAEERLKSLEAEFTELPEFLEQAMGSVQSFMEDYDPLYQWLSEVLSKLETQMNTKHCIGVTQNELEEHTEFEKDVTEQQEKLPQLSQVSQELLSTYPPGKWLQDKMSDLNDLLKELLDKCAKRKEHLEHLLEKWNEFEAAFQSIIDWMTNEANRLSVKVLNKEDYGVEEHLAVCEALGNSCSEKAPSVDLVEKMADYLEQHDGKKKNGSTDVSSRRNDLNQNWKSFSELLQDTKLRLKATWMQLQDALKHFAEQREWLVGVCDRATRWRPSFGDIPIIEEQIELGDALAEEAGSHDGDMKYLKDTLKFVKENSKKLDREPVEASIKETLDHFDHLKSDLQLRLANFRDSIPLWEEFTSDTTELQGWLRDVENRFESDDCQPGDAIQTANALEFAKSLCEEVKGKRERFQALTPAGDELTEVCDVEEDQEFIAEHVTELNEEYAKLLKALRDHFVLLEMRLKSWENYPVKEAVEVQQYLEEAQMELSVEISPEDDPEKVREFLEKLEDISKNQESQAANLQQIEQSAGSEELQESMSQNPDISAVTQQLKDRWQQIQLSLKARLDSVRKSYAIVADIEEKLRNMIRSLENHKSLLSSTSSLSGPQLEVDHQKLLQENKNCRQSTSKCEEELSTALRVARDSSVMVPNRLSSESESAFQQAEELSGSSQNWEEELSTRCEQWGVFKDQLREFTSCSEDLYNQLIIGIDSRPIGMFLEDLGAFGEQLKDIEARLTANCKLLPDLEGGEKSFLLGSSSEVKDFRSAFAAARSQTKETENKLKEYFERFKSWDEYFRLAQKASSWFQPFKVIVEGDIEDFSVAVETADPSHMVKRFREHMFTMKNNEDVVYGVRDFPLSVSDVAAEKDSVEFVVTERNTLVNSFDKLKSRLEEAFREAEAKEKKWRESAAETAERNKILEVEVAEKSNTISKLEQRLKRRPTRRHPCNDWKIWLLYFLFLDCVVVYLVIFKPKVFFPCNACDGSGPLALSPTRNDMLI